MPGIDERYVANGPFDYEIDDGGEGDGDYELLSPEELDRILALDNKSEVVDGPHHWCQAQQLGDTGGVNSSSYPEISPGD